VQKTKQKLDYTNCTSAEQESSFNRVYIQRNARNVRNATDEM